MDIKFSVQEQESMSPAVRGHCGVCQTSQSKYTCPRCNLPYCSVVCFKHQKHSGCSESFYKECFVEELKQNKASDEEKQRILEMLKSFEEDDLPDLDVPSLEERLENIDLETIDAEDLWEKLTAEEKSEFTNLLRDGCNHLVEIWEPWWLHHDPELVSELGDDIPKNCTAEKISAHSQMPNFKLPSQELSSLLGNKRPSPLVRNNLINVLYSYAFFCRTYNGKVSDFVTEFCENTLGGSQFLSTGQTLSSCEEAICTAMDQISIRGEFAKDRQLLVDIILDVYHILIGKSKRDMTGYILAGLSQLHEMCRIHRRFVREHPDSSEIDAKFIFQTMKRLEFLAAWTANNSEQLATLALKVISMFKSKNSALQSQKMAEKEFDKLKRNRVLNHTSEKPVLIEEIK